MPCCDTGRNVQKYKGGGGGASTLQEALENGNIATVAIELQSNGLFIGDGGGLSNIAGVGGSVGNIQQVTTSGATTSNKIILTNTNESLETSGNINVGNNKFYLGDGGLLSNTAGTITLQQASNQGNVINNTVSFTNAAESIVTTGKIVVGTSLEATNVNGNGSGLSSLNASNVSSGTLHNDRLSTKTGTGNIVMSASPTLSGTITGGTFSGTHDGNGSGLSSINASNVSSGTIHNDRLDTKTGTGNIVMSASPTLSGTITGGTFSGTHDGNGSGLSSLNASNVSTGTLHNDRLDTKTGTGNIVMSANPTLSGTITGGTFSGTHDGDGSGLSSLNASNVSTGTLSNDRLGTVPYNKGGTGQTSYTRGDIIYSDADNSLAKLAVGTEPGMFLRSDGTDVSWGSDGSRLSSLNASNVSTGTLSTSRGGTGNTFSSASKSDLLVGTSGGTFATLSIPSSSASGKVLKINTSDELYWGADSTSSGGGGGGSGELSLGSSYMSYASGTNYDTSTGEQIDLDASTADTANYIVVRDTNKNINVTKVTLGTGTLTQTEYSGKSATVTVGTDNGSTARSLAFVDGNSILKDNSDNLAWTPSSKSLRLGPSGGTSNTLTNILWSGKSSKIAIGNSDTSGDARPVLYGIGEIANKDTSDRLNWTPGGTHAGTLTIGTIGGTHSNITSSTFTGTATKVAIGTAGDSASKSIIFETGTNTIGKDTNAGFTYNPSTEVIQIGSSSPATLSSTEYSGTAAKVTVTNESNPSVDNTARAIPYLNGTILKSVAGTFHYTPDTGTVTATKFSGELPAGNITGEVPVDHGGTGKTTLSANHILIGNDTAAINTLAPESSTTTKFLSSSTNGGTVTLEWASPSVSQISITDDTTSTDVHGITFADGTGAQTIKSDESTLHYKPSTGTLTTSNLITSGTSQFNGIANTAPDHTLSVGQVFSIQEWNGSGTPIDVMVVRKGNAYFEGNVYVGKTLTVPSGGKIEADTIKVRSHNVSGTTVINERKASVQRID